jgi:hypothetical protein
MIYSFISRSEYDIRDRGHVYIFHAEELDKYPEIWDPNVLQGHAVEINGVVRMCTGVETYQIMRSKEHPYHLGFGILVNNETC